MLEHFPLKVDDDVELGLYTPKNAAEVFRTVMENYNHLYLYSPWLDENYSLERAIAFAELCKKQTENKETLPVTIYYKGEYVGGSGFHAINWNYLSTEIGYWLAEKHMGKGIITRVCRTLLDYGFKELGLNRIALKSVPENTKSRSIAERLGFTFEGIERDGGLHHGKFVDFAVYSMLAGEWPEKKEMSIR